MSDEDQSSINETDLDILKILSKDGRESFRKIAQELEKSPVTIKSHVDELEKNGVIKDWGVHINFDKLGYDIIAIIEITISKGKMLEVEGEIAKNPNVYAVYDITGTYDALILARFKTRAELSEMVKDIHASPFVESTNTHMVLNVIKEKSSLIELLEKEKLE